MIEAKCIYKSFGNVDVIKGIDLHIDKGEIVTIMGASGAGKSTLLQIIGTLEKADKGEVFINGQNVNKLNQKNLAAFRNKNIGFVFQFHHLLPEFTALENICIPAYIAGVSKKKPTTKQCNCLIISNLQKEPAISRLCYLVENSNVSQWQEPL